MAMLCRYEGVLLAMTTAQNTNKTGDTILVTPTSGDGITDVDQRYVFAFQTTQADGASSPTTTVKVQTSVDGTVWVDLVTATAVSTTTTTLEVKDTAALTGPFFKYLRAVMTLGGGTNPNSSTKVWLMSNAAFTVKAA